MSWQFREDLPIYTQLVERITQAIVAGVYAPGEKLPSVRDFASQAGVNPNTVQRALLELEQWGLLYTQRTAGRFVTGDTAVIRQAKQSLARQKMEGFLSDMKKLGFEKEEVLAVLRRYLMEEEA